MGQISGRGFDLPSSCIPVHTTAEHLNLLPFAAFGIVDAIRIEKLAGTTSQRDSSHLSLPILPVSLLSPCFLGLSFLAEAAAAAFVEPPR